MKRPTEKEFLNAVAVIDRMLECAFANNARDAGADVIISFGGEPGSTYTLRLHCDTEDDDQFRHPSSDDLLEEIMLFVEARKRR